MSSKTEITGFCLLLCASFASLAGQHLDTGTVVSIKPPPIDKSIPPQLSDAVSRAIVDGSLLYRNDTSSAVASDTMVASGALKDGSIQPTGWVTTSQDVAGDHWSVAFTEIRNKKPYAFADASVTFRDGSPKVVFHRNQPSRPITGTEAVLVHARDLAEEGNFLHCAGQYNQATSLVRRDGSLLILVDLMPVPTKKVRYPLGGFQQFTYVVTGDAKPSSFSLTKTCLNQSFDPSVNLAALMVTDITTKTPTNFHVFMSLSYQKPIFVLTTENGLMWKVDGNSIQVIEHYHQTNGASQ